MNDLAFGVVALALLAYAVFSRKLEAGAITPPIIFVCFGFAVGGEGFDLVPLTLGEHTTHLIAEITLIVILFTDAARIDLKLLRRDHNIPQRLLLVGMPLTITFGAAVALGLFPDLTLAEAALLAAVLAPTDAALGQAVVTNPQIPVRIRQALNVESGLNDGIALPLVVFLMCWASAAHDPASVNWLTFAASQLILGPLAGVAVGVVGGRLVDLAAQRGWMTTEFQGISALGLAFLAFALAEIMGGNGFIAAFVAGMMVGNLMRGLCAFLFEFAEAEGQLLTLFAFMLFGAAALPIVMHGITVEIAVYALSSLTVIRMLPVGLSLIGAGLKPASVPFLGWFGPRGLASFLFVLIVLGDMSIAGAHKVELIAYTTVLFSIFLHGLSSVPAAKVYAAYLEKRKDTDGAEQKTVSEMPLRTGSRSSN